VSSDSFSFSFSFLFLLFETNLSLPLSLSLSDPKDKIEKATFTRPLLFDLPEYHPKLVF